LCRLREPVNIPDVAAVSVRLSVILRTCEAGTKCREESERGGKASKFMQHIEISKATYDEPTQRRRKRWVATKEVALPVVRYSVVPDITKNVDKRPDISRYVNTPFKRRKSC
jgi:hypothetical protein